MGSLEYLRDKSLQISILTGLGGMIFPPLLVVATGAFVVFIGSLCLMALFDT